MVFLGIGLIPNNTCHVFIFPNYSGGLNNYDIGQHCPCSPQTITDFIWFLILQMVRCCGGFPLALIVNGKSLYGKPVEVLRSKAKNWSNGHSIFTSGSESDLLNCLRKSLEFSDNDIISKEYFMDLGSFSEDQWIPVPTLNDIWVELYELDEDGIDTIAILHELATWNLINVVRTRYDDFFFLLSDILVTYFLPVTIASCLS